MPYVVKTGAMPIWGKETGEDGGYKMFQVKAYYKKTIVLLGFKKNHEMH